jgi:hypothetical protein
MTEQILFPPLLNGLDYLKSVIEHLRDKPDQRNLKYAVLHLQAAVEVLLKARLIREHWSLVFEKPSAASSAARIESLVDARLARIEPELAARAGVIVRCPDCQHNALPIDHGDLRCRFCDRTFEPDDAASEYAAGARPGGIAGEGSVVSAGVTQDDQRPKGASRS